jgi:hypothetical protein
MVSIPVTGRDWKVLIRIITAFIVTVDVTVIDCATIIGFIVCILTGRKNLPCKGISMGHNQSIA